MNNAISVSRSRHTGMILALILSLLTGCAVPTGVPVAPETLPASTVTVAPPTVASPTKAPAPSATAVAVPTEIVLLPPDQVIADEATTNADGIASFEPDILGMELSVAVVEQDTDTALSDLDVVVATNGPALLIAVSDPKGQYLPVVREVERATLVSESSSGGAYSKPARVAPIVIIALIAVFKYKSWAELAKAMWELYQDQPHWETWSSDGEEWCVTPEQKVKVVNVATAAVLAFSPAPSDVFGVGKAPQLDEKLFISWLNDLLGEEMQTQASERLAELDAETDAVVRWRVTYVKLGNVTTPLSVYQAVGWCVKPLDRMDTTRIVEWVSYALSEGNSWPLRRLAGGKPIIYGELLGAPDDPFGCEACAGSHSPELLVTWTEQDLDHFLETHRTSETACLGQGSEFGSGAFGPSFGVMTGPWSGLTNAQGGTLSFTEQALPETLLLYFEPTGEGFFLRDLILNNMISPAGLIKDGEPWVGYANNPCTP